MQAGRQTAVPGCRVNTDSAEGGIGRSLAVLSAESARARGSPTKSIKARPGGWFKQTAEPHLRSV